MPRKTIKQSRKHRRRTLKRVLRKKGGADVVTTKPDTQTLIPPTAAIKVSGDLAPSNKIN